MRASGCASLGSPESGVRRSPGGWLRDTEKRGGPRVHAHGVAGGDRRVLTDVGPVRRARARRHAMTTTSEPPLYIDESYPAVADSVALARGSMSRWLSGLSADLLMSGDIGVAMSEACTNV